MNSQRSFSLKQQTLYYSVGMVIYLACQWLTATLVTRMDLVAGGILSLSIAVTNPFSAIALYATKAYQVSDIDNRFQSGVYIASRLITMLLSALICAAFVVFSGYTGDTLACIILYMLLRLAEALVDVFQGIEQQHGRLDMVGRSFVMRGIASTVSFFITMIYTKSLSLSMLMMPLTSFLVIFAYDIPSSKKLTPIKPVFDFTAIKQLLLACLPLTLNTFLVSRIGALPGTTLESTWGSEMMGIYSALAAPCIIVQTAGSFLFNPMIPSFALQLKNKDKTGFRLKMFKNMFLIMLITGFCAILGSLFGKWGLTLLFGEAVAVHTSLMVRLLISSGATTLTWFMALILIIFRDYKGLVLTNIVTLLAARIASDYLVTANGLYATFTALMVALLVQSLGYAFNLLKQYKKSFKNAS